VIKNCSITAVVRKFAFLPPTPPWYGVKSKTIEGGHKNIIEIKEEKLYSHPPTMEAIQRCQVHKMTTSVGETVYGFEFNNRAATVTILYAHGNAMDCAALMGFWKELSEKVGANIFALEYSGYGASTGEPSVANTYADIEAAYEYLIDEMGVPAESIILYGQSVGSGPVCELASRRPSRGVVLHCALMTGLQTIFGPPSCCSPSCTYASCDIYKNINLVSEIGCPVFIMHGEKDEVIHVTHGQALYRNCQDPYTPWWVMDANHNNIVELNTDQYYVRMRQFLTHLDNRASKTKALHPVGNHTKSPNVTPEVNPTSNGQLDMSAPGLSSR